MKSKAPNTNRPKCPSCGSGTVYYRKFTDSYLCRSCGKLFRWNSKTKKTSPYRLLKVD